MNTPQYDWLKIKTEFFTNRTISLGDLAVKYGMNPTTIKDKSAAEGWMKEKEEIWAKSYQKTIEKLPETIAQVRLRHAKIARVMISKMLENLKSDKIKSNSTYYDLKTAIDIERDAVGLNDSKPLNDDIKRLAQFNFIFSLKPDELQRFIESALSRAGTASSNTGSSPAEQRKADSADVIMDAVEVPR